jgi:hypothetical protein
MTPADPNDNGLDAIEAFEVEGWHVTIRQRVTGALFWIAWGGEDPAVMTKRSSDFPVGFTVHDVRLDAERVLREA